MSNSNTNAIAKRIRNQVHTSLGTIRNRLSLIKMLGICYGLPLDAEHQAKVDVLENAIAQLTNNALVAMDRVIADCHEKKSKKINKRGKTNGKFHKSK